VTKDEALKLALDDLIAEYHMETSSFAKRVDEIFKQALAAPTVQEPDELRHIGEQDALLDVDEKAWRLLVENRGGCSCHIAPPCGACSNPISEEEMNEVGYTYTTPPAAQKPWVGLTDEEIESLDCVYLNWLDIDKAEIHGVKSFAKKIEAKLKEKNA